MTQQIQNLSPLRDRVALRVLRPEKSEGGIFYPDDAEVRKRCQRGEVLAVGPGLKTKDGLSRIPMECRVGDIVHFILYSGSEVKEIDPDLLMISERDVVCVEDESAW